MPVVELREAATAGSLAEAMERAEGHVLLIGGAARHPLEPQARQLDHLLEVTLPEFLGRGRLAGLELPDPVGDRACGCHWRCARAGEMPADASSLPGFATLIQLSLRRL